MEKSNRKYKPPSFQTCAEWTDRILTQIGGPLGVGLPEARQKVYAGPLPGLDSDLVWHQPKKPPKRRGLEIIDGAQREP